MVRENHVMNMCSGDTGIMKVQEPGKMRERMAGMWHMHNIAKPPPAPARKCAECRAPSSQRARARARRTRAMARHAEPERGAKWRAARRCARATNQPRQRARAACRYVTAALRSGSGNTRAARAPALPAVAGHATRGRRHARAAKTERASMRER